MVGAETALADIRPATIKSYLAATQDGHDFAHHSRYRALRGFLNWCVRQGYINATPLTVRPPRLPDNVIPDFTIDEVRRMRKACMGTMGLRDEAMLVFLYDTGIRLGELCRMTLDNLDLVQHQVTILGKRKTQRVIRFGDTAGGLLWRYIKSRKKQNNRIWLTEESRLLDESAAYQALKRVIKRASITGKKASPHTFRHTYASNRLAEGFSMDEVMYLLGHRSLSMVERYARASKAARAMRAQEHRSPADSL